MGNVDFLGRREIFTNHGETFYLRVYHNNFIGGSLVFRVDHALSRLERGLVGNIPLVFSSLLIFPWLVRSYWLSGCFIYPILATCNFQLPWSVGKNQVINEINWIQSWARNPGKPYNEVFGNWDWLKTWFMNMASEYEYKIIFFAIIITLHLLIYLISSIKFSFEDKRADLSVILLPMGINGIGLIYWFFSAPSFRFGMNYIWSVVLLLLAGATSILLIYFYSNEFIKKKKTNWLIVSGLVGFIFLGLIKTGGERLVQVANGPDKLNILASFSIPDYISLYSLSGIDINIPTYTDQCWDIPLPCAVKFYPKLNIIINNNGKIMFQN